MSACSYRQLHAVDNMAATHGPHSIGAERSPGPIHDARTPSFELHDQAGCHCHRPGSSEPTLEINISADEGHPSREPDAPQHDTPLLSNPEIPDSSASVETRDDEPGNTLQRPTIDQSAEHTNPTWTDFYFRPLFLISLSVLLILMIVALEVLHYISQHNQGLVNASENMHYIWTYGPTFGKARPIGLDSL